MTLDPAKMPDVLGVHLGMPAQEALAVLHKTFPGDMYQAMPVDWWPSAEKPYYGYNVLSRAPGNFKDVPSRLLRRRGRRSSGGSCG